MVVASIEEESHLLLTGLASDDGEMLRASIPLDRLAPSEILIFRITPTVFF